MQRAARSAAEDQTTRPRDVSVGWKMGRSSRAIGSTTARRVVRTEVPHSGHMPLTVSPLRLYLQRTQGRSPRSSRAMGAAREPEDRSTAASEACEFEGGGISVVPLASQEQDAEASRSQG